MWWSLRCLRSMPRAASRSRVSSPAAGLPSRARAGCGGDSVRHGYPNSVLPQRLPHAVRGRDHAVADRDLAAHEEQRARAAHHAAFGLDEFADLHRVDEVHIEMNGRLRLLVVRIPGGQAERAVREGHDHAALHDAAAVVMLLLGEKAVAVAFAVLLHPEGTDETDEAFARIDLPSMRGGIECVRLRVHGRPLAAWRACRIGGRAGRA